MAAEAGWQFGPFWLDTTNERVWREGQPCALTPKAFALLRYLVEHAGQLVTKTTLVQTVWPGTVVSTAVLTTCMSELRRVLGDAARAPHYIETVHGRGYRFIGNVGRSQPASLPPSLPPPAPLFVGREAELAHLQAWLEQAQQGERQMVFITGEPGIGKTALVEAFVTHTLTGQPLWLGQGQCLEHYGAGEAYLPVLVALRLICQGPDGKRVMELFGHYAPTWLAQLPSLLQPDALAAVQRRTAGATRERMLRELAEALEVLTAEKGLVLVLEDLQWSDASTLDLLSYLARRRYPAQLLVIGTYRPAEALMRAHPLPDVQQELQLHGYCQALALGGLTAGDITAYLALQFPQHRLPPTFAQTLFRRTDGNPLFLVRLLQELVAQHILVQREGGWELSQDLAAVQRLIPQSLREMVEQQWEQLPAEERRVLAAASVAGAEFSTAAAAAGVPAPDERVDARCTHLARRAHFLRHTGTLAWPDGTVTSQYAFLHGFYHELVYERVPIGQRSALHRRIGERLEQAYGNRAGELAAALAVHFERGRVPQKAVHYHGQAAQNALQRSASHEALAHLTTGLRVLATQPETPARAQQELSLQMLRGLALALTKGYAATEVEQAYTRAHDLCQHVAETPQLFPVLMGLINFQVIRANLRAAKALADRGLLLARQAHDPALLLEAHRAYAQAVLPMGALPEAHAHVVQSLALYDPRTHAAHAVLYGHDPGVFCLTYLACVLWLLGYPDQARKHNEEALRRAQECSHAFTLAAALGTAAMFHQYRREEAAMQAQLERLSSLAAEHGFVLYASLADFLRGWARAQQGEVAEGISQMHQSLAFHEVTGTALLHPYRLQLLAEGYGKGRRPADGLPVIAKALALVERNEERWWQAELYRVQGELTLGIVATTGRRRSDVRLQAAAEHHFWQAMTVARRQGAKAWELRAVLSLCRLWQQQGKLAEARQLLAETYGWFTEGFETPDLREARALWEALR